MRLSAADTRHTTTAVVYKAYIHDGLMGHAAQLVHVHTAMKHSIPTALPAKKKNTVLHYHIFRNIWQLLMYQNQNTEKYGEED